MLKTQALPSLIWQFAKHGICENLAPQLSEHLHQDKSGKQTPWQQQAQLWYPLPPSPSYQGVLFLA